MFSLLIVTVGQSQTTQQQDGSSDDDVVRISVNLVQVDAVVTDKDGRQVTNLRAEDFQLLEDGRPQKITNFSYVSTQPVTSTQPASSPSGTTNDKDILAVPPARLRPEQGGRTVALVVDDLRMSFESMGFVRQALEKFVAQQMQQGDLVAILRTRAGSKELQRFTSDKKQLYAAIEQIRWYPGGFGSISAFPQRSPETPTDRYQQDIPSSISRRRAPQNRSIKEPSSMGTISMLNSLKSIVEVLGKLPGRKFITLLSDGFPVFKRERRSDGLQEAIHRLTDLANRASVVIYTIDARGLQALALQAADDLSDLDSREADAAVRELASDRSREMFETQLGLNYLAQQTGGYAIRNDNDLNGGIQHILEDQKGYYLIAYRPDESTFDKKAGKGTFHTITVKVNRPDLRVRSRKGFYGDAESGTHH